MVLTGAEVKLKGIVHGDVPAGWRNTTYDATVSSFFQGGAEVDAKSFTLRPRSIVWVVSAEVFKMPADVTGLATLKTQWTHEGLLALNVGVIDPGWNGPLSAALVNFSNADVTIKKGDPFFRILFHDHNPTRPKKFVRTMATYKGETSQRSRLFSPTFLNMDLLVQEVSDKVLQMPRWAVRLTIWGLIIAMMAIFAPIAFGVWTDYYASKSKIEVLEKRIDKLEAASPDTSVKTGPMMPTIAPPNATPGPANEVGK